METVSDGPLDPWYVTGFIEGAGSFTYSYSGRQLALYFAVKVRAADQAVLEVLRDFFGGVGRIYPVRSRPAAAYWRVQRRGELRAILEHFDRYPLRTAKATTYEIWRAMVLLKQQFRKPDRARLETLAQKLSAQLVR